MNEIMDFLPFLIPLIIVEFVLLIYTLHHILTHTTYKRGNRFQEYTYGVNRVCLGL